MTDPASSSKDTYFAPAGRAAPSALADQVQSCVESPMANVILQSLGGYVLILNEQRQILAANPTLLESLEAEGHGNVIGRRWGEVSGCIHAPEGPDGCGTSKACSCCGAAIGIANVQTHGAPVEAECRMAMRHQGKWEARELQVSASRLELACGQLVVVVFQDISDRKRRELLESAFVHDLANSVLVLNGWSDVLTHETSDTMAARRIVDISRHLSEVVKEQRVLIQAESGNLHVEIDEIEVKPFLSMLASEMRIHPAAKDRLVEIEEDAIHGETIRSDRSLLLRILQNMVLNALEAIQPGEAAKLSFARENRLPVFSVHNPGSIPEEISLQIFHRSFSSKSKSGRGIGTHSIKLLGENYLNGKVGFRTSPREGTTFFIRLP